MIDFNKVSRQLMSFRVYLQSKTRRCLHDELSSWRSRFLNHNSREKLQGSRREKPISEIAIAKWSFYLPDNPRY